MTILDHKNPRFFSSIPTADGRFMVASMHEGRTTIMSPFIGSLSDVEAICAAWNKREMDRYAAESGGQQNESVRWPSLEEIAARMGIKI